MLITKFNKLIKSKVILIALAFIIVLAFVGLPVASEFMAGKQRRSDAEGTILGEDVPTVEFLTSRFFELKFRTDLDLTADQSEYLRQRVWQRIAALRYAGNAGIVTTMEEIKSYIKRDEAFAMNGQFDTARFNQVLQSIGITEDQYVEFMRQELVLSKLSDAISSSLWVPHSEARERAGTLMDSYIAEYVEISESNTIAEIKINEEDAKSYFEDNKELFRIPEKINVRYIAFPASEHMEGIEVTDKEIEDNYYDNMEQLYSTVDTNGLSTPIPLEEVKTDIADSIKLKRALDKAAVDADKLVGLMAPARNRDGIPMDKAAAKVGREIKKTDFFSSSENIPGVDKVPGLARLAFALDPDDVETYFSDPILGTENVYVIAAGEKQESRLPVYADVAEEIAPILEKEIKRDMFVEKANDLHSQFEKRMKDGGTFSDMARSQGMNIVTTSTFNAYDGFSTNEADYAYEIIPNMLSIGEGELAEPIDTSDGIIIAWAAKRIPADALTIQAMKPQVTAMIERYRHSLTFEDWMQYNLTQSEFTDYRAEARMQLDLDEDESESEESEPVEG